MSYVSRQTSRPQHHVSNDRKSHFYFFWFGCCRYDDSLSWSRKIWLVYYDRLLFECDRYTHRFWYDPGHCPDAW